MKPIRILTGALAIAASAAAIPGTGSAQDIDLDVALAGRSADGVVALDGRYRDRDDRPRHGGAHAGAERQVTCQDTGRSRRPARCALGGYVGSYRLISASPQRYCAAGRDWGVDRDVIWVGNGCRVTIAFRYDDDRDDYRYGDRRRDDHHDRRYGDDRYGDDRRGGHRGRDNRDDKFVLCQSGENRYWECDIPGRFDNVYIASQRSVSSCRRGADWGVTPRGIWVDNGCRAVFGYDNGHGGGRDQRYSDRRGRY